MNNKLSSRVFDPSRPFRPSKSPVYYGWIIGVAGTIGIICSIPGQTMGVSVFTDHLIENLEISRTSLGMAYLVGTIFSGFLVSWMGRWLDRNGLREGAVVSGFGLGCALLLLSQIDRVARFLSPGVSDLLDTWIKFGAITAAFFFLRFFGQGLMTLASRNMIAKWFDLFRGRVTAISGIIASFAFSTAPWALERMIADLGWRGTWILLAVGCGFALMVFAALIFRDNPEECGLEMDAGRKPKLGARVNEDNRVVREFTKSEAVRTYSFWVYNLSIGLQGFFITGYTFNLTSIASDLGVSESVILGAFMPAAAIGVLVSAGLGWLIDYTRMKYAFQIFCIGLILAPSSLLLTPHPSAIVLLIVGMGIAGGAFAPIMGTVWARFYGRSALGAISGFNMSSIVIASAFGPIVFSLSLEYTGSYRAAIWLGLFFAITLMFAGFFADNPQRRIQREESERG